MPEQYMEQYVSRRQSAPRLEFEAAAIYEYPEHLRPWLEALPKQPGVYIFHGESDTLPLYIGKSVNIRSRVLSHLRTPDEAAMLRQSRRITWFQTAGEMGALLLEARLIKEQQPLFNKRLRRNRSTKASRRSSTRGTSIFLMPRISMGCSLIKEPHFRRCRRWRTNSSFATAFWALRRPRADAPVSDPR